MRTVRPGWRNGGVSGDTPITPVGIILALAKVSPFRAGSLSQRYNYSDDEQRNISVVECYLDESGTDGQSPTAVVGGLLLRRKERFYLRQEWAKTLAKHGVTPPIHMREFGPHGRFKDLPSGDTSKPANEGHLKTGQ
jgi:hypothetical protein